MLYLLSPSDVNILIFFYGVLPKHLIPHPARHERRVGRLGT